VAGVDRLALRALSPAAVAALAGPGGPEPAHLYEVTAGNPFYVTEVLAAAGPGIPATVRDAVLTRPLASPRRPGWCSTRRRS
jgi:hypothetical protein